MLKKNSALREIFLARILLHDLHFWRYLENISQKFAHLYSTLTLRLLLIGKRKHENAIARVNLGPWARDERFGIMNHRGRSSIVNVCFLFHLIVGWEELDAVGIAERVSLPKKNPSA